MNKYYALIFVSIISIISGCSRPNTAPDQTVAGAALGAAWGAGTGAIIGNQVGDTGSGAGIGAGFGAIGGAMAGYGFDRDESGQAKLQQELSSLKIQNLTNQNQLRALQSTIDRALSIGAGTGVYQVFFDDDATNLRAGAIANLEVIADSLRTNPNAFKIKVAGNSDDAGTPDYNLKVAEARARSVSSYLMARGISNDQIVVESYGSTRPIASNSTDVGRQLNRRVDIYILK